MDPENSEQQLPITEQENPRTANLSSLPVEQILRLMNEEDALVSAAISRVLSSIERAVNGIVTRLSAGGRLFYIGTGTSGRLGVLDASECPPTFGVSADLVQGIIAGGYDACYRAVEASEDEADSGVRDLETAEFTGDDVLVGIAASGRTPYTVGALSHARSLGAFTIAITCVPDSEITKVAEVSIVPVVGPEVVAGSTRLKAGTAQKMVLNMLSTATMVKLGYVSGNRMSNLKAGNQKLRARAVRILMAETGQDQNSANATLVTAGGDLRVALVMSKGKLLPEQARDALNDSNWVVEEALRKLSPDPREAK
jgi:N-acetylmuramic acid 6-phosphate etherase